MLQDLEEYLILLIRTVLVIVFAENLYFDFSVYKSNQHFRIISSSKFIDGGRRPLIILTAKWITRVFCLLSSPPEIKIRKFL